MLFFLRTRKWSRVGSCWEQRGVVLRTRFSKLGLSMWCGVSTSLVQRVLSWSKNHSICLLWCKLKRRKSVDLFKRTIGIGSGEQKCQRGRKSRDCAVVGPPRTGQVVSLSPSISVAEVIFCSERETDANISRSRKLPDQTFYRDERWWHAMKHEKNRQLTTKILLQSPNSTAYYLLECHECR